MRVSKIELVLEHHILGLLFLRLNQTLFKDLVDCLGLSWHFFIVLELIEAHLALLLFFIDIADLDDIAGASSRKRLDLCHLDQTCLFWVVN